MIVEKISLSQCHVAEGFVVVIDVLRAFTTAAFAFGAGAREIDLVETVEEAFARKKKDPSLLLMGEVDGQPIPGFDFGNSPVEIGQIDLKGKRLVQRTTAGTLGVVKSQKAQTIYACSFVVAEATLKEIVKSKPSKVIFVITGTKDGDEDLALADYLEKRIEGYEPDPKPYLKRVLKSKDALTHRSPEYDEDVRAAAQIDHFHFAMKVFPGNVLRRI